MIDTFINGLGILAMVPLALIGVLIVFSLVIGSFTAFFGWLFSEGRR